ncbi:MAG: hypothetical protein DRP95_01260 [Candidatus Latescibacterota bacterium]|nr:MAG: hypothetical protein DRP95_01260 [Candidatus Latescibacterota bacterium]
MVQEAHRRTFEGGDVRPSAEPIRVLIVDDDEGNAILAREAISSYFENCSVDIACDGEECMRLLGQKTYDVILLDQTLPDIEGLSLFDKYKKAGFDVPTVMVTGTGNEEIAVEAMKAGVYDYVVKTADLGYLKTLPFVVQESLRRRQMERELEEARMREVELERLKAVREIVVTLSHEINNPLTVILGTVELMLMRSHKFDEKTVAQLRRIEKHTRRIRDLVHKLNNISQLYTKPYLGKEMMIDVEKSAGNGERRT